MKQKADSRRSEKGTRCFFTFNPINKQLPKTEALTKILGTLLDPQVDWTSFLQIGSCNPLQDTCRVSRALFEDESVIGPQIAK